MSEEIITFDERKFKVTSKETRIDDDGSIITWYLAVEIKE